MSAPAVQKIETRLFLNNEFVPSSSGKTFPIKNPLTEEHVCDVYEGDSSEVDAAVKYAKAALPGWRDTPLRERTAALRKLADVIETHSDEISYLEWCSFGKTRGTFGYEVQMFVEIIRYYAGIVYDVLGVASLNTPNQLSVTFREPYGITAAICAWNSSFAPIVSKITPALLTGNVIIVKPSEKSPLTLTFLGTLIKKYNIFPPGVYQVVNGFGPTVGAPLASHMEIRKLSFTGSGPTGRILKKLAAESNLKNVTLELGGKSPQIVFEDADFEEAAKHAAQAITANAGQICIAPSRVYVHKSIAPKYVEVLKATMAARGEAHALPTEHLGHYQPQADEAQFKRVLSMIESGKTSGAELLLGGERATEKGYWVKPTIFYEVPEDAHIQKNEVFGPVINVNTFEDEEDVIKRANDTEYGLWANIYSKDIARALRVAKRIEAGCVNINQTGPSGYALDLPFGGYKQSGEGKELGRQGLEAWVETKSVLINIAK